MRELERRVRERVDVVTVDVKMDAVDLTADLTKLPFKDASFEGLVCSHVLEHIEQDRTAMSEIFRVLQPGGRALIMVPKDNFRRRTYEDPGICTARLRDVEFRAEDHVRRYGSDFIDRLNEVGFTVEVPVICENMTAADIERYGLSIYYPEYGIEKCEDIHVCKKPGSGGPEDL